MTAQCEHDVVWRQLAIGNDDPRSAPPTEAAWCGTCGALYVRGEWRLPTAFEAFADEAPMVDVSSVPLNAGDKMAIIMVKGKPTALEVRPGTCPSCGWEAEHEPESGQELPVVKGALDAQAEAETRAQELRLWVLRLADHFERVYQPREGTSAVALIAEARKVAGA